VLGVLFARDLGGLLEVTQRKSEVETVLWVGGNLKRHIFVPLALQEAGDLVVLVFGHGWQCLLGSLELSSKNQCLVFHNSKGQGKRNNVDIFIGNVNS
jgi:hypothetical protein